MRKLLCLGSLLLLASCTQVRYVYRDPPALPELDPTLSTPCPKMELLKDKSIGTLSIDDNAVSGLYGKCRAQNIGLINVFNLIRDQREKFLKEKVEAQEQLTKKKK